MATFYTDEENDKKTEEATQPLTQTSGAGAVSGGQSSAANKGPSSSGSFVDLGKYYEAGKDKVQQVQQQVAGSLEGKAQEAKQQVSKGVQDYAQGLQSNRLDSNVFAGRGAENVNEDQFRNIFTDRNIKQYQDAGGMENYRQAARNIGRTATSAGRTQALRSIADKGYSSGESRLDSFLLNRAERDKSVLGDLRNRFDQQAVENQIGAAQQRAGDARQAVIDQRDAVRKQAQAYLTGQQQGLNRDITAAQDRANRQAQEDYTRALRSAWDRGLVDKRAEVVRDIEAANDKARKEYAAGIPMGRVGQSIIGDFGSPKQYEGDFNLTGPKTFEEALAQLAGGQYAVGNVRGAPALSGAQQARLDAYNRLRGIAGTGDAINVQQATADRTASAQDALRALIQYGGVKERQMTPGTETLTRSGETQEAARARQAAIGGGIAGGTFRQDQYGNIVEAPQVNQAYTAENLGFGRRI